MDNLKLKLKMKKIVLCTLSSFLAWGAMAQQNANELLCKGYKDAVVKSEKNTEHSKKGLKSATWVELGEAYLTLAQNCTDDSTAVEKAENAYKKALEIENAAGGKKSGDIESKLKSESLAQTYLMAVPLTITPKTMLKQLIILPKVQISTLKIPHRHFMQVLHTN